MRKVDRGEFYNGPGAYEDNPRGISYNATISAPHMHAYCLEWLKDWLKPEAKVLDVGCGSGYLCAAFYEMLGGQGKVVGIEHIEGLAEFSSENLGKSYSEPLSKGIIEIVCGDGRLGYEKYAPYDVIHVGAAAESVPKALIEQLNNGGCMVIPAGKSGQQYIM
eukprot:CAMPEP_0170551766 /NCGR_PEP_ID=MMETSP0211-20121228/9763_1 /TAXON_ID=311385 /ORGANISM="Pseudokeronopsis sp., Strain OXSARD2" /LENGTH=162 /DNA_ID=CAMNT_0010859129 /DNA_START=57 /DNA_END=545 /DNA_ORIENTATION=+